MKRLRHLHLVVLAIVASGTVAGVAAVAIADRDGRLAGRWRLTSMTGHAAPPQREYTPTVTFARGGQLNGYDGCNRFSGTYRIKGDRVKGEDIVQTLVACPGPGDPDLEARGRAFKRAVADARFERKDDVLTLRTPTGQHLTLRRRRPE